MIKKPIAVTILSIVTLLGVLVILISYLQKSPMYTPVDVNTSESLTMCPVTFGSRDFSVTLDTPCQWTSCTADSTTVNGQDWEGSMFLSIQAKPTCALGFEKTGPFGSPSVVDTDVTYYFDTGRTFEDWLAIREKDIEGQNNRGGKQVEYNRTDTKNDSPETAVFQGTDVENNWDSGTVYSFYKVYQHRTPYMFELAITVPHSKEQTLQNVIDHMIQSFASEVRKK